MSLFQGLRLLLKDLGGCKEMQIDGKTRLYAVLGNPVAHSLSPAMHNAAFEFLGLNSIYTACCISAEKLEQAVAGFKALGFSGGNVTVPHKTAIIPYLDGITDEARLMGAVNTLYWQDDHLWGTNTDGPGFVKALVETYPEALEGKNAVLLGAGGAARAVAVALVQAGIKEILIINRSRDKAQALIGLLADLGAQAWETGWDDPVAGEAIADSRLIVNTTSLGMEPRKEEAPPIDYSRLLHQVVVDLIYKPRETLFLYRARQQGCKTMNGLRMLLEQGVLAFERWTGEKAPVQVMSRELERWA